MVCRTRLFVKPPLDSQVGEFAADQINIAITLSVLILAVIELSEQAAGDLKFSHGPSPTCLPQRPVLGMKSSPSPSI